MAERNHTVIVVWELPDNIAKRTGYPFNNKEELEEYINAKWQAGPLFPAESFYLEFDIPMPINNYRHEDYFFSHLFGEIKRNFPVAGRLRKPRLSITVSFRETFKVRGVETVGLRFTMNGISEPRAL